MRGNHKAREGRREEGGGRREEGGGRREEEEEEGGVGGRREEGGGRREEGGGGGGGGRSGWEPGGEVFQVEVKVPSSPPPQSMWRRHGRLPLAPALTTWNAVLLEP